MNHHDTLGVPYGSSREEIKRAYRRKTLECHSDPYMFEKVKNAYERLSESGSTSTALVPAREKLSQVSEASWSSVECGTIATSVTISFDQAWRGCTIPIRVSTSRSVISNRTLDTFRSDGETIYIDIPAGTDDGEIIRCPDAGNEVNGVSYGVHVTVNVSAGMYERRGLDIYYRKVLTLREALTGFSFDLKLCDKVYTICNEGVVQPNTERVIPNIGIRRNSHVGALIIRFDVSLPVDTTPAFLKELENIK